MENDGSRRTEVLDRRYARHVRIGLLVSVLVHIAVVLAFRSDRLPPTPFAAAGPAAGDDRAARGGGIEAIAMRSPVMPREVPPPPEPIVAPEVELDPVDEEQPEIEPLDLDGLAAEPAGSGEPRDGGEGRADGDGAGAGGDADSGESRAVPPRPRGLMLPPADRPDDLRGREVEVWVFVDVEGRVVSDSTRLNPSTGDRGFDRRLREQAAEWVFSPAMRGGRVVAEWFRYVVTL